MYLMDISLFLRKNGYCNSVAHKGRKLPFSENSARPAFIYRSFAKYVIKSAGSLNDKSLRFRKGLIIRFMNIFYFRHFSSANQPPKSEELSLTSI